MSTTAISTAIKTTLSTVKDDDGQVVFQNIIEGEPKQFTAFPSLTINLSSMDSEIKTSAENLRHYNFRINCYIQGDTENSWADARKFQDVIVDTLDTSQDFKQSSWIYNPAQIEEITKEIIDNRTCLKIHVRLVVKALSGL